MKPIFIFLLLFTSILNSCKKDAENSFIIGVDVGQGFNQDSVQVFIDGKEEINGIALQAAGGSLGVCIINGKGTDTTIATAGNHEIKIIANNSITYAETFSLVSDLFLRIDYYPETNKVSIIYSKERFLYD